MTVEELCREYLAKAEKGLIMTRRGGTKRSSTLYTDKGRIKPAHRPPDGEADC